MYLLDPSKNLTRDELLQNIWNVLLTPAHRAKVREIAEAHNMTPIELLRKKAAEYDALMEDPAEREQWLRTNEEIENKRATPFGPDPTLGGPRE